MQRNKPRVMTRRRSRKRDGRSCDRPWFAHV